jgi:hypothetical protein
MEQAELTAANKRIRELENEVAILKGARGLLRKPHDPKCVTGHGHMAAEGLTVQLKWRPPFFDEPRKTSPPRDADLQAFQFVFGRHR